MTKTNKLISAFVSVMLALAMVMVVGISIVTGKEQKSNIVTAGAMVAEDEGIAIINGAGLNTWLDNPTTNAYLANDITDFIRNDFRKNTNTKVLDGRGKTIVWTANSAWPTYQDTDKDRHGYFCGQLEGTFKNFTLNFVGDTGKFGVNLGNEKSWNQGSYWIGLVAGQISSSGKMENIVLNFNKDLYFENQNPAGNVIYKHTNVFSGLFAGNVNGTMENCTLNMNALFKSDFTYLRKEGMTLSAGAVVARVDGGKMYNTTINVGEKAVIESLSTHGMASLLTCRIEGGSSVIDGVVLKGKTNLTNVIQTRNYNNAVQGAILTHSDNYNLITNVYTQGVLTSNVGVTTTGDVNLGYSYLEGKEIFFNPDNRGSIFIKDGSLSASQLIWSVTDTTGNKLVYNNYDKNTKTTYVDKSSNNNKFSVPFRMSMEQGNYGEKASIGFESVVTVYGNVLPKVSLFVDNILVPNAIFDYTTDNSTAVNEYGYTNAGEYRINTLGKIVAVESTKTVYDNAVINAERAKLKINQKEVNMTLDTIFNNVYKTVVNVEGLLGNEKLVFNNYPGVQFGNSNIVSRALLDADKQLKYLAQNISSKNYRMASDKLFSIKPLVVKFDSRIYVSGDQDVVGRELIVDRNNLTMTFKKAVDQISIEADVNIYGMTFDGFTGAREISKQPINTKIKAIMAIDENVSVLGINGKLITKNIEVKTATGGTAKVRYNGSLANNQNVPIGKVAVCEATPNNGMVFIGWTNANREWVSADSKYSIRAKDNQVLTANFAPQNASQTKVILKRQNGDVIANFYTTLVDSKEIIEYANANYSKSVANEAFSSFSTWLVDKDASGKDIILVPAYDISIRNIPVMIDEEIKDMWFNQEIKLEKGEYVVNNVKVTVGAEGLILYAMENMQIFKLGNEIEPIVEDSFAGAYFNDYLNMTMISKTDIAGDIELIVQEAGISKYSAVIKYTKTNNSKIAQAIVKFPRELTGNNVKIVVKVNGVILNGKINSVL